MQDMESFIALLNEEELFEWQFLSCSLDDVFSGAVLDSDSAPITNPGPTSQATMTTLQPYIAESANPVKPKQTVAFEKLEFVFLGEFFAHLYRLTVTLKNFVPWIGFVLPYPVVIFFLKRENFTGENIDLTKSPYCAFCLLLTYQFSTIMSARSTKVMGPRLPLQGPFWLSNWLFLSVVSLPWYYLNYLLANHFHFLDKLQLSDIMLVNVFGTVVSLSLGMFGATILRRLHGLLWIVPIIYWMCEEKKSPEHFSIFPFIGLVRIFTGLFKGESWSLHGWLVIAGCTILVAASIIFEAIDFQKLFAFAKAHTKKSTADSKDCSVVTMPIDPEVEQERSRIQSTQLDHDEALRMMYLTKVFDKVVVNDLTLSVRKHETFGLLGPNGNLI